MNLVLCQHKNKFNYFNVLTGKFEHNEALNLPDLQQKVYGMEGEKGLEELPGRIKSSKTYWDLKDLLFCNRAGPEGENLSVDECVEYFLS